MESRGVASLCFSGLTLGGLGVTVSLLSSDGVSAFTQTFWRFTLAALFFLALSVAVYRRETLPGRRELVVVGIGGGMMLFASLTFMGAIALGVPVPNVSFLSQMSTVFTIVLAVPLLHERLTTPKVAAVCLGMAGVFLISQPWRAGGGNLLGEFLIVLNALNFSLFTIFNREFVFKLNYRPQLVSTWVFSGAALWSLPFLALNLVQLPVGLSPREPFLVLSMACISTFVPYSLMNAGLKRIGAGEASVLMLLSPVSSTILSYFVLKEVIGTFSLAGSSLIILSVIFLAAYERRNGTRGLANVE